MMPLGMEVGLSPGNIMLDGDPAALPPTERSTAALPPTFRHVSSTFPTASLLQLSKIELNRLLISTEYRAATCGSCNFLTLNHSMALRFVPALSLILMLATRTWWSDPTSALGYTPAFVMLPCHLLETSIWSIMLRVRPPVTPKSTVYTVGHEKGANLFFSVTLSKINGF